MNLVGIFFCSLDFREDYHLTGFPYNQDADYEKPPHPRRNEAVFTVYRKQIELPPFLFLPRNLPNGLNDMDILIKKVLEQFKIAFSEAMRF